MEQYARHMGHLDQTVSSMMSFVKSKLQGVCGLVHQVKTEAARTIAHARRDIADVQVELEQIQTGFQVMQKDLDHFKRLNHDQQPIQIKTTNTVSQAHMIRDKQQ